MDGKDIVFKNEGGREFVDVTEPYFVKCVKDSGLSNGITLNVCYKVVSECYKYTKGSGKLIWYGLVTDNDEVMYFNIDNFCNRKNIRNGILNELLKG